jgi:hypothetical protein
VNLSRISARIFEGQSIGNTPPFKEVGESKRMLSSQMILEIHLVAQFVGFATPVMKIA